MTAADDPLKGFGMPRISQLRMPEIRMPQLPLHHTNPAEWTQRKLIEYIRDFEAGLDNEHEVGARLVSFGSAVTFHIEHIGYAGPYTVCFSGITDQGERVQLIQHFTQLSVLLIAMKKLADKPHRIGFDLGGADSDQSGAEDAPGQP